MGGRPGVRRCQLIQVKDCVQEGSEQKTAATPKGPGKSWGREWGIRGEKPQRGWEAGSGPLSRHPGRPPGREAGWGAGPQHELGTREHRGAGLREMPGGPARVDPGAAARAALLHLPVRPPRVSPDLHPDAPSSAPDWRPALREALRMELQGPPPTLNVLAPLTLPFSRAGIAVYPKVREMWTFCQKKQLPMFPPP